MRKLLLAITASLFISANTVAVPIQTHNHTPTFDDALKVNNKLDSPTAVTIVTGGRLGEKWFNKLGALLNEKNYQQTIVLTQRYLKQEPNSGLLYEVQGCAYFYQGDYKKAARAFERATSKEPRQSGAWSKLGITQMQLGDLAKAESSLKQAITLSGDDRFAHQRLGILYDNQGKDLKAIQHYWLGLQGTSPEYLGVALPLARLLNGYKRPQQAVELLKQRVAKNPKNEEAQRLIASSYMLLHDYDAAKQHYQSALALNKNSLQANLGLAIVERKQGDMKQAKHSIDTLIKQNPKWAPAYIERGEWLLANKQEKQAYSVFKTAGKLNKNRAYAHKRMAQYAIDQQEKDAAKAYFNQALATQQADEDTFARYSELLLSMGEYDAGEKVLNQGTKQYPKSEMLQFRKGAYLASLGRYESAITEFNRLKKKRPNDPNLLRALILAQTRIANYKDALINAKHLHQLSPNNKQWAMLYGNNLEATGDADGAISVYQNILKSDGHFAPALNNLAVLFSQQGRLQEAAELAEKAVEQQPKSGNIKDTLGWIYYQQGAYQKALPLLREAANTNVNSAEIHYHLGAVLSALGKKSDAKKVLENALKAEPNAPWSSDAKRLLN